MQAFSSSPDRSKHGVGIVEAHPLPARHTLAPAQESAERPKGTVSIVDAQPLPARHTAPSASSEDVPRVPEHSAQSVGIVEAHPLPARRETPDGGTDKVHPPALLSVSSLSAHPLVAAQVHCVCGQSSVKL